MRDTDSFPTPATVESLASSVAKLVDEIYLSLETIGTALTILWGGLTEKLRSAPSRLTWHRCARLLPVSSSGAEGCSPAQA